MFVYGGRRVSVPEPEYSVQGYASATMQCYLVKRICWNLIKMGCAGKSKVSYMNKARFRLDSHAVVHKALKYRA